MNQTIRIIGGQYRGKKLSFLNRDGLRPTSDRIRETLFNWLMHDVRETRCLDAFSGSGALGFEAFSRGAAFVLLLEKSPSVYHHLNRIAQQFHTEKLMIQQADACRFLNETNDVFDLVFLDPPFADDLWTTCIHLLSQRAVLRPGGLVYLESPTPLKMPEQDWEKVKSKKAGNVFYALYRKRSPILSG